MAATAAVTTGRNIYKTLFYGTTFVTANVGLFYWLYERDVDNYILMKRTMDATCRPYLFDYLQSIGFGQPYDSVRDFTTYRRLVAYHDCLGKSLERYGYQYGNPKKAIQDSWVRQEALMKKMDDTSNKGSL